MTQIFARFECEKCNLSVEKPPWSGPSPRCEHGDLVWVRDVVVDGAASHPESFNVEAV